jgi:hypothetical protein
MLVMPKSLDSGKNVEPIAQATNQASAGNTLSLFTEEALLRLQEGLRAQEEQRPRPDQPPKSNGAGQLCRDNEQMLSQNDPLPPGVPVSAVACTPIEATSETARAGSRNAPALLTEGVLLRFEEALRAQREQARSHQPGKSDGVKEMELYRDNEQCVPEKDIASTRPKSQAISNSLIASTHIAAIGQSSPLAPSHQPQEPVRPPFWRRQKLALLTCGLLFVFGAAAVAIWLKERPAAPAKIEARALSEGHPRPAAGLQTVEPAEPPRIVSVSPNYDMPVHSILDAAKSSILPPPLPALPTATPSDPPADGQRRATPAGSETAAMPVDKATAPGGKSRARQARTGHPRHASGLRAPMPRR